MAIEDDDWRLQGQEKYLLGRTMRWATWAPYREDWDHDHCEFCMAEDLGRPLQRGRRPCEVQGRVGDGGRFVSVGLPRVLLGLPGEVRAVGGWRRAHAITADRLGSERDSSCTLRALVRVAAPRGIGHYLRMDDQKPSGLKLNVPPSWPWYTWALPVVLVAAVAVWQFALSYVLIGATFVLVSATWVMFRFGRLSRYRS